MVVEDFLPLDLGSSDVKLGMKWLEMLGATSVNWKTLTVKFKIGEMQVVLQGDLEFSKSAVTLKVMMKALKQEG